METARETISLGEFTHEMIVLYNLPNAGPGHLDEAGLCVLSAERVLHRPQEVVGLEDEEHLAVDLREHLRYLHHVLLRVLLYLSRLKLQNLWSSSVKLFCNSIARRIQPWKGRKLSYLGVLLTSLAVDSLAIPPVEIESQERPVTIHAKRPYNCPTPRMSQDRFSSSTSDFKTVVQKRA